MNQLIPPHSIEAEEAVLGAVLLSPRVLLVVRLEEGLNAEDFYRERNATVFGAMLSLSDREANIDVLTVTAELEKLGKLADVGGPTVVDALAAAVPVVGHVREYARRVIELAQLRIVMQAGHELVAGADSRDQELIDAAERKLASRARSVTEHTVDGDAWRQDVMDFFDGENEKAWDFPWRKLNEAMGGMRRGETTAVGAWTNFGKSPLVDQVLDHAHRQGARCHLYSNEGSRQQRALRNVARIAGVDLTRISKRDLSERSMKQVLDALEKPLPFGYTDCTGWTADEIARDMRWRRYDVVGLDMLHNIDFDDERQLARVVNTLVSAAILSQCHLLVTVHFNEERAKNPVLPVPVLRDIRGSGMIKNRVDNVLFLHREQDLDEDGQVALPNDDAMAYFTKVRYGELTGVRLVFNGAYQRFLVPEPRA